jgi:methionyl-tRNA formyltransferase
MSTPEFGIPTLHALRDRRYEVSGVVCQPDKPAGRGLPLRAPAMKQAAQACGVPVFQPDSLRAPEAVEALAGLRPELLLVAAYGKYIPAEVVRLAPAGALNLHPSLLPRWRGACPVPAAVLAGDRETGVTVHFLVDEMDAGDILGQAGLPIGARDRSPDLMARLATLGAGLYVDTIEGWLAGRIAPRAQDHSQKTWCDRMTRESGRIDWTQPAARLARQVRAFDPWPGVFTGWDGMRLRILDAEAREEWRGDLPPGQVFADSGRVMVATGCGALVLRQVQAPGKRAHRAREVAAGRRGFMTARLG